LPAYDSGDHLHLNAAGYQKRGVAFPRAKAGEARAVGSPTWPMAKCFFDFGKRAGARPLRFTKLTNTEDRTLRCKGAPRAYPKSTDRLKPHQAQLAQ